MHGRETFSYNFRKLLLYMGATAGKHTTRVEIPIISHIRELLIISWSVTF